MDCNRDEEPVDFMEAFIACVTDTMSFIFRFGNMYDIVNSCLNYIILILDNSHGLSMIKSFRS